MASFDKTSVRAEVSRLKTDFEQLCADRKITAESKALMLRRCLIPHQYLFVVSNLGFRPVKNDLRVATLADSSGGIRYYSIGKDCLDSMDYVEAIQSDLSGTANSVWAQ
jgi:hypothetical protein